MPSTAANSLDRVIPGYEEARRPAPNQASLMARTLEDRVISLTDLA